MTHARNFPQTTARRMLSGMLVLSLVSGCQTMRPVNNTSNDIDAALQEAKLESKHSKALFLPADISQALLPPLRDLGKDDAAEREVRFDLSAEASPARQIFMSLVEGTSYSMVVHPDVKGTMSLQLKGVTVPEAVDAIREVYGYEYRRDGRRYFVLGNTLQTRVFSVNYLDITRKGRSEVKVSSGELKASSATTTSKTQTGQTPGIQVETLSESNFWKTMDATLKAIIGTEGGRQVVVNAQAGLVVVKAAPNELRVVAEFLGLSQANVNRQVILEAKIIEVELEDRFQAGINWSGLGKVGDVNYLTSQTGGGKIFSGSGVSDIAGQAGNLQPDAFNPVATAMTSAFGGVFALQAKMKNFAAMLELLKTQGKVQVLSSPRISTVNSQKAVIKVGGDEFFVTNITNSTATTGSTTTSMPSVELTPFFSGIALDVTPQIDSNKNVVLHIHPSVSNVTQRDKNFVVSGQSFSLPLAFSTIQESDSVVRAVSGEIIVIGGLMKEAISDQNASVPLLGDLPLVGGLFKHQKLTRIKKELIILLKPTVLEADDLWGKSIQASQDGSSELERTQ